MNEELPLSLSAKVSGALGFTTGFIDACGFIAIFGITISFRADHSFVIGLPALQSSLAVGTKFICFPLFAAAIAAGAFFMLRHRETRFSSLVILIGFQVALIASFLAVGLWALPFVNADDTKTIAVGFVAAVTMGFQRALSYFLVRHVAGTVSLTDITQTMVDMGELVYETSAKTRSTAPGHLEKSWIAIVHFACGVMAGILGYLVLSFWCLVIPIAMLLWLVASVPGRVGQDFSVRHK